MVDRSGLTEDLKSSMFTYVMEGWVLGTSSISDRRPVQCACWGKSTVMSRPLAPMTVTVPMLRWVTDPHLYLGVVTLGFTRTLSPTLIVWPPPAIHTVHIRSYYNATSWFTFVHMEVITSIRMKWQTKCHIFSMDKGSCDPLTFSMLSATYVTKSRLINLNFAGLLRIVVEISTQFSMTSCSENKAVNAFHFQYVHQTFL